MKIYQLHKSGGEWEDAYDIIIGSYLKKERAEEKKAEAESDEECLRNQSRKCNDCPFLGEPLSKLDSLFAEYPNYCSETKFEKYDDYDYIECENYYMHFDESYYEIQEVEVEE